MWYRFQKHFLRCENRALQKLVTLWITFLLLLLVCSWMSQGEPASQMELPSLKHWLGTTPSGLDDVLRH